MSPTVRLDLTAHALYVRLNEHAVVSTHELSPELILDMDKDGVLVGVEVLLGQLA